MGPRLFKKGTMKVKIAKSGKVALSPAGPVRVYEKGQKDNLSADQIKYLRSMGYIEKVGEDVKPPEETVEEESSEESVEEENSEEETEIDDESSEEESEDIEPDIEDLLEKIGDIEDESEKKSVIEDWATVNLGIDLDRRKSSAKMIEIVKKKLAKQ